MVRVSLKTVLPTIKEMVVVPNGNAYCVVHVTDFPGPQLFTLTYVEIVIN